ncbi:MAG: MATE family efflux transporter [Clostridia bacterium]|nr:MATE family efflux transporter [Clostridia bacterium]
MKTILKKLKHYLEDKDERNLLINVLLAFGVKGISMVISLYSMPLYIKYFENDDVLGLWYTILSLLNWILICDLGLGNGLRNRLTTALATGNSQKAKNYISSTYAALTVLILPVTLLGGVLLQFVDLNRFLNIDSTLISPRTLGIATTILFVGICLNFVLKTINVIIYAVQKSSLNNILYLITSVIPLIFIFLFKGKNVEQNLIALTVVHVLALNLPPLLASLILFKNKLLRSCTPSLKHCTKQTALDVLTFGLRFFLAQIFFMLLINTNEILLTKIFGSDTVVDYSIYYKLFTFVGSLFMLALTPIWSKVTKDLAQKRYQRIRKTNRFLYLLAVLAAVAEFTLVPFLQLAINIWLKEDAITVHLPTALIFAFYGSMYIFNVVLTTIANGMGDLRTQIVFFGIASLLKLPTVLLLDSFTDHWAIVVLYNGAALLLFCCVQLVWVERKLKNLTKETDDSVLEPSPAKPSQKDGFTQ